MDIDKLKTAQAHLILALDANRKRLWEDETKVLENAISVLKRFS